MGLADSSLTAERRINASSTTPKSDNFPFLDFKPRKVESRIFFDFLTPCCDTCCSEAPSFYSREKQGKSPDSITSKEQANEHVAPEICGPIGGGGNVFCDANQTVGEYARQHGYGEWMVRRAVDLLGVPIPRIGQYRALTPELEARLDAEMVRRGALKRGAASPC